MLARAVVVKRRRGLVGGGQQARRRFVERPACSASKVVDAAADPLKPGDDPARVDCFAAMGRTRQGQFRVVETEGIGRPHLHQGQCLDRFYRGPGKDRAFEVSPIVGDAATRIDDHRRAAVAAFHGIAAGDLDQRYGAAIGHGRRQRAGADVVSVPVEVRLGFGAVVLGSVRSHGQRCCSGRDANLALGLRGVAR